MGLRRAVQFTRHHHKLVATQTGNHVRLAQVALQAAGHGHQQLVAHVVPVLVVDGLETVQIHHVDRQQVFMCGAREG